MTYDEFKAALNEIFNYWQAKYVEKYVVDLWFEPIKHIPTGPPLQFIIQEIKGLDRLPKNIPKAFRTGWDSWMRANQDKITRDKAESKTRCDYCGGSGLIHTRGLDHGNWYSFVSRCPGCSNWTEHVSAAALPCLTNEQLFNHGYEKECQPWKS